MLRDETLAIGKMLEGAMMRKHGPAQLQQHYMVMDTICDATQVCLLLGSPHCHGLSAAAGGQPCRNRDRPQCCALQSLSVRTVVGQLISSML